jgi:hypothetical protein
MQETRTLKRMRKTEDWLENVPDKHERVVWQGWSSAVGQGTLTNYYLTPSHLVRNDTRGTRPNLNLLQWWTDGRYPRFDEEKNGNTSNNGNNRASLRVSKWFRSGMFNHHQRSGKFRAGGLHSYARDLVDYFLKHAPRTLGWQIVYRGMNPAYLGSKDASPTSASTDPWIAEAYADEYVGKDGIVAAVLLPPGTPYGVIGGDDKEIILPPGKFSAYGSVKVRVKVPAKVLNFYINNVFRIPGKKKPKSSESEWIMSANSIDVVPVRFTPDLKYNNALQRK